jgi:hypothetical protein
MSIRVRVDVLFPLFDPDHVGRSGGFAYAVKSEEKWLTNHIGKTLLLRALGRNIIEDY